MNKQVTINYHGLELTFELDYHGPNDWVELSATTNGDILPLIDFHPNYMDLMDLIDQGLRDEG